MDTLISLLIDLLSWIFDSATKKRDNAPNSPSNAPPADQPGQPRPSNAPPLRKPVTWEDELRRLLGEEQPLKPQIPPSLARPKRPPTIAPKPIVSQPIPVSQPPPKAPPIIARASDPGVVPLPVPAVERVSTGDLAKLEESRIAYERASQLDKIAAERIKKVPGQPVTSTSVVLRKTESPEIVQALALVKNARSAREAIAVSVVLGPPRALEPF
ncbi:MAG TPA: hypothetical protein VFB72_01435 [Verrucomicrobiae bacterium]|nr:hypothetical protein [Verrucomicrobiae bacterium]